MENDSQKRTVVAFGLIFLLTAVYMTWFAADPSAATVGGGRGGCGLGRLESGPGRRPAGAPAHAAAPPSDRQPPAGPAVRTSRWSRKTIHYVFSTEGAGLISARLQGEKTRDQRPSDHPRGLGAALRQGGPEGRRR